MKTRSRRRITSALLFASLLYPIKGQTQFKQYESPSEYDAVPGQPMNEPAAPDEFMDDPEALSPAEEEVFSEYEDFPEPEVFNEAPPANNRRNRNNAFGNDEAPSNVSTFGKRTSPNAGKPSSDKYVNLNPETAFGPEIVTSFDFPETDILDLTKHMQQLTGINLILDKDVKGKVSITAPTAITVGDAWKAYLAALNMAGYTLVKSGAFYKVMNARDVRYVPTSIYTGSYTPDTEAHIMKIIALKNVDAGEISRNFRPFMSRYGRIIDIKQTNTIIISDTGSNIARLETLIKFLDVPGHEESLQIIPVKNSSAQEIAKLLDEILKDSSAGRTARPGAAPPRFGGETGKSANISKIIAEPRTNSIIAMANADGAEQLRNLISKLDTRNTSRNSGRIHVRYMNYGNAEELAKTLSALVSGSTANRSATPNRNFAPGGGSGEIAAIFNDEVKVTADKNNNALVVTAAPTDWLTLKNVIDKLDIPRDQVYVEGMIMETTLTRERGFGIEFIGAYGKGNAQRGGFTKTGSALNSLLATGNPTNLSGFFAGFGGPEKKPLELNIGGNNVKVNTVNGLIQAIASNSSTNVLATPQILAMDNTEAEFQVGATIPVLQTSTANNGTTTNSVTNQEAKLTLKITPQINKVTRMVKLNINQSINDFVDTGALTPGQGAATNTRSAVTEVMVRDQDTIAMGGLLRDKESVSLSKIPLLGDIPVLGWLFKSKSKKVEKVNLLFFLTPRILSPYNAEAANQSLAALEARNRNLKEVLDDDDEIPYPKVSKELQSKLEKQAKGPLYNTNSSLKSEEEIRRADDTNSDVNAIDEDLGQD